MPGLWLVSALLALHPAVTGIDRMAELSSFVFRGRIVKSGASTMHVAVGPLTAVVLVEEVYYATTTMPDVRGKEITLNLVRGAEAGLSYVFFTNVWLYGTSIAARESGRLGASEGGRDSDRQAVEGAFQRKENRALQLRIDRAALVLAGRVLRAEPLKRDPRWPESEHDPQWWSALLQVEAFAKGQGTRELVVVFPASRDELWIQSPKFEAGQEGVWILQKDTREKVLSVYAVPGYTALDPRDFQPREAWDKVRRLAARKR